MFNDEREYIILNENAYFYKRNENTPISRNKINSIFRAASVGKIGNYLFNRIKETITIGSKVVSYSLCVFKFSKTPAFISSYIESWVEIKLAYLLIVEIDDYVVMSKKNISGINSMLELLTPIDYEILSSLFVDDETSFEQFSLQNMNISDKSVRSKSISSEDLKGNFSPLGAGSYILKNMRVKTQNEKITLALNTSRINKFGLKNGIPEFISWADRVKNKIVTHDVRETFLSIFAEPQDFEKVRDSLTPIAILLDTNQIIQDVDDEVIERVIVEFEGAQREINIVGILSKFSRLLQVSTISDGNKVCFKIENKVANDFYLKLNAKSITLTSKKLKAVKFITSDNDEVSILDYINQRNDFITNFEDLEFVYTKRKLFKDSKLLGNIQSFLKIFKTFPALENTTSEKGEITNASTSFGVNSVFQFVEDEFQEEFDYFICDDIGREWADHIGINDNKISFFHSKSRNSVFSASDFQDVVGQAQKNFGNLTPTNGQLARKEEIWQTIYRGDTQIVKLRKGDNVSNAVVKWKETLQNPNLKREVNLVVDFISKRELEDRLIRLRNGESFQEKNEIIQILWFISSFISSSQELGVESYICCKP